MSTFGLKTVPDDISAYVTSGLNNGSIRPEQIATILTFANRAQTDYIFRTYNFSTLNDFYRFNIYSEIEMDSPSNAKTSELGVVCFRLIQLIAIGHAHSLLSKSLSFVVS